MMIAAQFSLPWPAALAVLIAIGAFPRRGDEVRPDHVERISRLATAAGPYVRAAQNLSMPDNFKPFDVLQLAKETSNLRYLQLAGSAIAAEYMQYWAELISRDYAAYARLTLFSQVGQMALLEHEEGGASWLQDHKAADYLTEADFEALTEAIK